MIKILHIVSSLSKKSGVMSFIMNYYRYIDRTNFQFEFLYWIKDENSYAGEILSLGGNIHHIPKPSLKIDFINEITSFFRVNGGKYHYLHLHEVYLNSLFSIIRRKYNTGSIIVHAHTTKYSDKLLSSFRNQILCFNVKKNGDFFFACSEDAGRFYYGDDFYDRGNVEIIRNAIDTDLYLFNSEVRKTIRSMLSIDNKLVVGHVGRFNNQKNHKFLIDVFCEIEKREKDSVLLLVGEGPLKNEIVEMVKDKGISDKILFLGQRSDVNKLLQGIDVFILPSLFEGLGIVLVEAQVSGLKCFASDVIPKEVKICKNLKFLSLNDDLSSWASEIIKALKESNNDRRLSRELTDIYDIKNEVFKIERLYYDLIE